MSVCCQIRNLTPFFVTPSPTSRTLVDVLDVLRLRARCLQAISNLQILDIFLIPVAPTHYTRPPMHLIRVPKEGLAVKLPISQRGWATPTLKYFKLCQKHAHIKKFSKTVAWVAIFCPTTQFCGGRHAESRPLFFQYVPEHVPNHLHYFSVYLKTG